MTDFPNSGLPLCPISFSVTVYLQRAHAHDPLEKRGEERKKGRKERDEWEKGELNAEEVRSLVFSIRSIGLEETVASGELLAGPHGSVHTPSCVTQEESTQPALMG